MSLQLKVLAAVAFAIVASISFGAKAESAPHAPTIEKESVIPLIHVQKNQSVPVEDADTNSEIPARTVFFELNPVDAATSYNIQVKALTQHWAAPYTTAVDGTTLRLRL